MRDKLLFTPDFGESDSYHFNLSLKYFLSDSLKKNSIPFWTNSLSGGYPLFSESQIGSLFLPNIIFLKFLHFTDGYTLLFIFAFICLTVGFFLLLREFEIGLLISIFMSIMLAFNGAISLRWVHLNLIQTFSLIPFCFFVSLMYLRSHRLRYVLTLSFLVSQMFFAGHVQVIFIGMLGLIIWVFLHEITDKKSLKEIIIEIGFICCAFILGIVIALPQILPTYLLSQQATRSFQLDYQLTTSFPLTWSHLKSFFDPFPFGNPQNGTYPVYSANWGIFWENTPYLGRFFLPMLCIALFYLQKAVLRKKIIIYGILFSIFTLLALGKNSPLYFVFNFFPFNLFRTP
ncbi:hypothetical protein HY041_03460, partial [Candidatus Roizmanbacteria bacterium]|nr:hypothetical protein [Candidatus Roizmanbacteria bacterium]